MVREVGYQQTRHSHLFNYKIKIKAMVNQVVPRVETMILSKCKVTTSKVILISTLGQILTCTDSK